MNTYIIITKDKTGVFTRHTQQAESLYWALVYAGEFLMFREVVAILAETEKNLVKWLDK